MKYLVLIWITLLLHSTEIVQSVRFFIVPSQDSPCPGEFTGDPCFTLAQYNRLSNINPERVIQGRDVTLDLQPGIHRTDLNSLSISEISSFVLTGTNTTFNCEGRPQLLLSSIADVQITGVNFMNCPDIEIRSADLLNIKDCSFEVPLSHYEM